MTVIINGTTGIDTVQDGIITNAKIASMAATKLTGQVPDANAPSGSVIQVVSTTKTDTFSTTSTSFVDVTGLSATITPLSSSSRILISFTTNVGFDQYRGLALRLMRDSTPIGIGDAAGSRTRAANFTGQDIDLGGGFTPRVILALSNNFLDSPNTTAATTYKIQIGAINETDGSTIYVNRSSQDQDISLMSRVISSITLMEIAG